MIGHELHEEKRNATRSAYGDSWETYQKTYQVCECGGYEQEYEYHQVTNMYLLHLIEVLASRLP